MTRASSVRYESKNYIRNIRGHRMKGINQDLERKIKP